MRGEDLINTAKQMTPEEFKAFRRPTHTRREQHESAQQPTTQQHGILQQPAGEEAQGELLKSLQPACEVTQVLPPHESHQQPACEEETQQPIFY